MQETIMRQFDMAGTSIIVGVLILYLAGTLFLTVRLRSKNAGDFMVAARSMPAIVVGVLMMSEFVGAKSTIGTAQSAFESGLAASWAVLSAAIGFPLFGVFLARKLYSSGEITISGAIASKYGRSTQVTVSLIMIYALLLVNVGYYVSGAAAISGVLHISLPVAEVIVAIVSTFYCAIGGMKSMAYVSVMHTTIKYVGVFIVLAVALSMTHGVKPMLMQMPHDYFTWDGKIGVATIGAWTIANVGAIFSTQYIIQAVSSLKRPDIFGPHEPGAGRDRHDLPGSVRFRRSEQRGTGDFLLDRARLLCSRQTYHTGGGVQNVAAAVYPGRLCAPDLCRFLPGGIAFVIFHPGATIVDFGCRCDRILFAVLRQQPRSDVGTMCRSGINHGLVHVGGPLRNRQYLHCFGSAHGSYAD
jgi:hypothetical protein